MTDREYEVLCAAAPVASRPRVLEPTELARELGAAITLVNRAAAVHAFFVGERGWSLESLRPHRLGALYDLCARGATAQAELTGPIDWSRERSDVELERTLEGVANLGVGARRKRLAALGVPGGLVKHLLKTRPVSMTEDEWRFVELLAKGPGRLVASHKISAARRTGKAIVAALEVVRGQRKPLTRAGERPGGAA